MNDLIFKILTNKQTVSSKSARNTIFKFKKYKISVPNILSKRIELQIKKKQYSLIRQMIDIYRNEILTNFESVL